MQFKHRKELDLSEGFLSPVKVSFPLKNKRKSRWTGEPVRHLRDNEYLICLILNAELQYSEESAVEHLMQHLPQIFRKCPSPGGNARFENSVDR